MTIGFVPIPFGARNVKIYPLAGEAVGTGVNLPYLRTLSFSETESYVDLRGDDALKFVHGVGPTVSWDIEAGGVCLEAVKALFGGTITETTANSIGTKVYAKKIDDIRPYVTLEGQAISDTGGDFHVKIYRARATGEFTGKMADSAFWMSATKGMGLGRLTDGKLYDFIQNDTAVTPAT